MAQCVLPFVGAVNRVEEIGLAIDHGKQVDHMLVIHTLPRVQDEHRLPSLAPKEECEQKKKKN